MPGAPKPRVVVTIHGIRTHGKWQKEVTPFLANSGVVPIHIDYGWFPAAQFFIKATRERKVQAVRKELRSLVSQIGQERISIIAHSFGTYLAMEALMRENGNLRYDRVVLTGSIVSRKFDWKGVFEKRWVLAVRNERCTADWVVKLADWVSRNRVTRWLSGSLTAGQSGVAPFEQNLPQLLDDYVVGSHSETHNELKFDCWARFVAYPALPEDLLNLAVTEMQLLRQEAAQILGFEVEKIRVNLFAPVGGRLRILPGAHDNMKYLPELDLEIRVGHGATGAAYETGDRFLVVKKGNAWSGNHLPPSELAKVHPALKWVISLPVKSEQRSSVVGVINIDGLDTVPQILEDANSQDCKAALLALHAGMLKRFQPCLEAAFRGERLQQAEG